MTEGYKLLAAAIIKQCLLHYREALQSHDIITTLECEQFLRSQWFDFMSDMNGEKLIKMMREEFVRKNTGSRRNDSAAVSTVKYTKSTCCDSGRRV